MKSAIKKRLSQLIFTLQEGFIERDTAVRLTLLSLLNGEYLLLIGVSNDFSISGKIFFKKSFLYQ
ncbi:MAG: hypothetical protein DRQ43_01575 [Gammaproteobacteria bacterium]|nr:MAG: hypothetical protein DRQ43_01575 [Gammaproteobacteria bacterium]